MFYLYVKTHNKTGLKYLGQTSASDPYKYTGSGKIWKAHIKKYGYDVTTDILFTTTNKNELKSKGLELSKLYNVVESTEWANLKVEEGDGGWSHCDSFEYRSKGGKVGGAKLPSDNTKLKISISVTGPKNARYGTQLSADHKLKLSKAKIGNKLSDEHKMSISKAMTGNIKPKLKCPHCDKEVAAHVAFRYHYDNCKKQY